MLKIYAMNIAGMSVAETYWYLRTASEMRMRSMDALRVAKWLCDMLPAFALKEIYQGNQSEVEVQL